MDHSGQQWINIFNDVGETLLGHSANEMNEIQVQDSNQYDEIFKQCLFKPFVFKIRAKQEYYNNEAKIRCNVVNLRPLNFADETRLNLGSIEKRLITL
jgi:replication factor A1